MKADKIVCSSFMVIIFIASMVLGIISCNDPIPVPDIDTPPVVGKLKIGDCIRPISVRGDNAIVYQVFKITDTGYKFLIYINNNWLKDNMFELKFGEEKKVTKVICPPKENN